MSHTELSVLRQVTREAQEQSQVWSQELPWPELEAQLRRRIEAREEPRYPLPQARGAVGWGWLAGGLAAAAAGLLWLGIPSGAGAPAVAALQASSLGLGEVVRAEATRVQVEHAGLARWTLEPYSSARLVGRGGFVTVELLTGALGVEVQPGQGAERFAVELARTRIAVRGTAFRVERRVNQARVVLERGRVMVGPTGSPGRTQGWLMTAPAGGNFGLDGALNPPQAVSGSVVKVAEAQPAAPPSAQAAQAKPSSEQPQARAPGAALKAKPATISAPRPVSLAPESALDHVAVATRACFVAHTQVAGVRVSAATLVSLQVAPSGKLTGLTLNPPLSPAVQRCVWSRVSGLRVSQPGGPLSRRISMVNLATERL